MTIPIDELATVSQELGLYEGMYTVYIYRLADGRTQVRAPDISDPELVVDMLEEGLRAMHDGDKVATQ